MRDPLLEVQQELRRRKNRTVRMIFWSADVETFTIIVKGDEQNLLKRNFNLKPGPDWDAVRCADWIEHQLSDKDIIKPVAETTSTSAPIVKEPENIGFWAKLKRIL